MGTAESRPHGEYGSHRPAHELAPQNRQVPDLAVPVAARVRPSRVSVRCMLSGVAQTTLTLHHRRARGERMKWRTTAALGMMALIGLRGWVANGMELDRINLGVIDPIQVAVFAAVGTLGVAAATFSARPFRTVWSHMGLLNSQATPASHEQISAWRRAIWGTAVLLSFTAAYGELSWLHDEWRTAPDSVHTIVVLRMLACACFSLVYALAVDLLWLVPMTGANARKPQPSAAARPPSWQTAEQSTASSTDVSV